MKIKSLTSWMGPAYVGTLLSTWLSSTLYIVLAKPEPLGHVFVNWLLLVAFATPVACALATTMLVLDAFLVRFKLRAVPTGRPAWGMSLVAPVLVGASYLAYPPGTHSLGAWGVVLSVGAPVLASALLTRVIFGRSLSRTAS